MTARRTRIATGALVAACLLVAACSSAADDGDGDTSDLGDADPGECATIDMAVSSEKIALLTELANDFNGTDAADVGHWAAALGSFEAAQSLDPDLTLYSIQVAGMYARLGRPGESMPTTHECRRS